MFIVIDQREAISSGYQKIPYPIVNEVEYELKHKTRLVTGGNQTIKY
jgi:hypothetical protein